MGPSDERLVITPLFLSIDDDADQIPDRLLVSFKVFAAGTNTVTLNTVRRGATYPDVACSTPVAGSRDIDFRFGGYGSASRVHVFIDLKTECQESGTLEWKESHKTMVYSADVVSDGNSWANLYNSWQLQATGREDLTGDGLCANMIVLAKDNPDGTTTARVIFTKMSDGAIQADNKYMVAKEL